MSPEAKVVTIKRSPRKRKMLLFDSMQVDIKISADTDAKDTKRFRNFVRGLASSIERMVRLKLILQKLGHLKISVKVNK